MYPSRASKSAFITVLCGSIVQLAQRGIVIQEPTKTTTNIPDANNLNNLPQQSFKRDADQYMPIAKIINIMRRVLPANAKIADDAKETIQECVSEFISFITSEANKRCHGEYRKTITPKDVLSAMGTLGFDNYIDPLTIFLNKYRSEDPDRNTMHRMQFKRDSNLVHQPEVQMARPPPMMGYKPTLTSAYTARGNNYVGLPHIGDYHVAYQSIGEGSSNNLKYDSLRQFK
ncbi:hypothetical protein BUALT_Bualt10G0015200 [Buddleja alternifolia]|uniref:Transcription factor CBF/NF-Y/archaeal histone domain-containing protein n=1 Tax=Buddleja alternifolia TaxID=168488 RepID=A0AAV6WWN2_9LAMI|nr:hypothetical protein BUALT_Bualt10G0015200 [Buddleja alternifolia]